jgi:GNAT superfamily N-acetyltransferase
VNLLIRRAGLADVDAADRIIREVAEWLIDKGEPLWGPQETSRAILDEVARAGELGIGFLGSEAAACMFLHNEDREFWPEDPPREALYVHRLAVARKFAGRGLSRAMLDWAEEEARAAGRPFVRLDCEPRPKLVALYRAVGYVPVDPGPVMVTGHLVIRQQKRVAPS